MSNYTIEQLEFRKHLDYVFKNNPFIVDIDIEFINESLTKIKNRHNIYEILISYKNKRLIINLNVFENKNINSIYFYEILIAQYLINWIRMFKLPEYYMTSYLHDEMTSLFSNPKFKLHNHHFYLITTTEKPLKYWCEVCGYITSGDSNE